MRERFWLDLGSRGSDEEVRDRVFAALGDRFALHHSEDHLGNGRIDVVSIPWARMPFSTSRQVRRRLVELLDERLPGWRSLYTLNPISREDHDWLMATAPVVFEDEVTIQDPEAPPNIVGAASAQHAAAYAEAATRGLVGALDRMVSGKHSARAWRMRQEKSV